MAVVGDKYAEGGEKQGRCVGLRTVEGMPQVG
jgi:hypothetical protein